MDQESSVELIGRAQSGDTDALERLLTRFRPRLQRWASGRLPRSARAVADTEDLVQDALIGTFRNIRAFDNRGEWALQAYLRQAVLNRIRDEIRRRENRQLRQELDEGLPSDALSPLEQAMGKQVFEQYEKALAALDPVDRESVIARLELGASYEEIAVLADKPSAAAARMAVTRALARLATKMTRP